MEFRTHLAQWRGSLGLLAAFALCLTATIAQAAGFRLIEVPADADSPALSGAMWYPCSEPPGEIDLGVITLSGAKDCPISGDKLPLVVVSHGNLGAFFDHHDTAETLADAGFVVAAISHRGDNSPNFPDGADPSVMLERPTDIKRLIDFMVGASPAASNIDPKHIGFFGFSAGGYTGLVLIGADPDWAAVLCRFSSVPLFVYETSEKSSGRSLSRLSRESRPPSSPTRLGQGFGLPPTALRQSKYRFNCGRRKPAGATCHI